MLVRVRYLEWVTPVARREGLTRSRANNTYSGGAALPASFQRRPTLPPLPLMALLTAGVGAFFL
jgi:hypothetical protein